VTAVKGLPASWCSGTPGNEVPSHDREVYWTCPRGRIRGRRHLDSAVLGPGDIPALDRLVVRAAVRVQVGECVDLGGDGIPVQPGELLT